MTTFEKSILKYIALFMLVFFTGRLIFLFHNWADVSSESLVHILKAFVFGLRMDLSAVSYFSPLILINLLLYYQTAKRGFLYINLVLLGIAIFAYFSIVIAELPIYDEWQTKLNPKAVSYLQNPHEVWNTATLAQKLSTLILVPLLTFGFVWWSFRIFRDKKMIKINWVRSLFVLLLSLGLGFVGARGGFFQIPLSVSGVFYSQNRTLNFTAVNSFWNLGYAYYKESRYDDATKFVFYSESELNRILSPFYLPKEPSPSILKTQTPNIVWVIFESWSADLVDTLHQQYQLMPRWNQLRKESLYFDHCYATGRHSEEGILAGLAGFPSLANSYIMGFTDKNAQLPSVNKMLKTRNYEQSFYFGGDLGYANIKSFFYQNPYAQVSDMLKFPTKYPKGKLGYHDEALYAEMSRAISSSKEPFFVGGFTTSTHSPYDAPMSKIRKFGTEEDAFMNTTTYADSCLGAFFDWAKQQNWYANTLFVLVSDHSHPTGIKRDYCSPEDHRIVFMLSGGALKDSVKGGVVNKIMSQTDLPATILSQMGYDTKAFEFSRDVLSPNFIPFAYFSDKTCQGALSDYGFVQYSLIEEKVMQSTKGANADSLAQYPKAWLQKSYTQFRSY